MPTVRLGPVVGVTGGVVVPLAPTSRVDGMTQTRARARLRYWAVADPDDAALEDLLAADLLARHHVVVDVDPWSRACLVCGPVAGRTCPRVAQLVEALGIGWPS